MSAKTIHLEAIASTPACNSCSCRSLCALSGLSRSGLLTRYPAGESIVHQGAPNMGMQVICEGLASLSEVYSNKNDTLLYIVKAGDILGTTEYLLGHRRYHMSARSLTDCAIAFFPHADVTSHLESRPLEIMKLLRSFAQKSRRLEQRFILRDAAQASDRLISTLLWLAGMDGSPTVQTKTIPFPLDRTVLSILIGVRPETVTRMMSRLKAAHVLSHSKGHIVITNCDKLASLLTVQASDGLLPPFPANI